MAMQKHAIRAKSEGRYVIPHAGWLSITLIREGMQAYNPRGLRLYRLRHPP